MELTPIKIRGKGPRKKGWKPPQAKRQRLSDGTPVAASPPKTRKIKKPAALIESLPLEILERIFHFSQNLNLPRSSPRIGHSLSPRSFLLELVVSAFIPTWDVWFGCTRGLLRRGPLQSYYGYDTDKLRIGGDPNFQSDVLACPWFCLDMVLDALGIWYRRYGRGRYYEHVNIQCKRLSRILPSLCDSPHEAHSGGFDHLTSIRDCFELDWRAFSIDHDPNYYAYVASINTIHIGVHPLARVPDSLVTGPFDWEKARLLFWLRCNGAALAAPAPDTNWELVKLGLDNIIGLSDDKLAYHLVRLFHSWGVFQYDWPTHIQIEVVKGLESRFDGQLLSWFMSNPIVAGF